MTAKSSTKANGRMIFIMGWVCSFGVTDHGTKVSFRQAKRMGEEIISGPMGRASPAIGSKI